MTKKHTNAQGLSRNIGKEVRRQLRKEAGFGCVICGLAIGDYEHIDPEFKDATEHNPARMAFLCTQCHAKITRKFLSKEKVWEAKKNPFALQQGRVAHEEFDIGSDWPKISIGTFHMSKCENLIMVNGETVLGISPPEEKNGPFRVNARFTDPNGNVLLCIKNNVWEANIANWDVEASGGRITFKDTNGKTTIAIKAETERQSLVFEDLNLSAAGYDFKFDKSGFYIDTIWGGKYIIDGADLVGFASAILIEGPRLVIGADGREGCNKSSFGGVRINPHVNTQDDIRAIFKKKSSHFGVKNLAHSAMGGPQPETYSTCVFSCS